MRIALDTNRYRDLSEGDLELVDLVTAAREVYLPFVVVAEVKSGFGMGRRAAENERLLSRFLFQPGVAVAYANASTLDVYASLFRQLRKQGKPIPTNDIWIAAVTIQLGLTLATRDRHFEHLPQIRLV